MNEIIERIIDASVINNAPSFAPVEFREGAKEITSRAFTDFVTSGLDESKNNDVVKIIAAAMQIASESGWLETPSISPFQTATTAVNICQKLNLSYLLEQGQIMAEEAADAFIDQAAATASVLADVVLEQNNLKLALDFGLDALSVKFPPIKPVTDFAKQFTGPVASFVSDNVKPIVQNGIKTIANVAKEAAHGLISKGVSILQVSRKKALDVVTSILS